MRRFDSYQGYEGWSGTGSEALVRSLVESTSMTVACAYGPSNLSNLWTRENSMTWEVSVTYTNKDWNTRTETFEVGDDQIVPLAENVREVTSIKIFPMQENSVSEAIQELAWFHARRDELEAQIYGGPNGEHRHHELMSRHRRQWPELWDLLDELLYPNPFRLVEGSGDTPIA